MTFWKFLILILIFVVSRVGGSRLNNDINDENSNSRDRIETASQNFQKYWITAKGRNFGSQIFRATFTEESHFSHTMPKNQS